MVPTDSIITPSTVIKIEGQGLPDAQHPKGGRGSLYLNFDIQFPDFVSQENKDKLVRILREE